MAAVTVLAAVLTVVKPYWGISLVTGLALWYAKTKYLSPLNKLPGPWLAGFSKAWFIWHGLQGEQHLVHLRCHEKYGPVWRAMPNYVLINDPQYLQKVYRYDRNDWYNAFNVNTEYTGTASTLNMAAHNWKRKRVGVAVCLSPVVPCS